MSWEFGPVGLILVLFLILWAINKFLPMTEKPKNPELPVEEPETTTQGNPEPDPGPAHPPTTPIHPPKGS